MPAQRPLLADPVSRNALVILAVIAGRRGALRAGRHPDAAGAGAVPGGDDRRLRARARGAGPGGDASGWRRRWRSCCRCCIFGGAAFFIADNATAFATQLVAYTPKLNDLIARVAGYVGMEAPPVAHPAGPAARTRPATWARSPAGCRTSPPTRSSCWSTWASSWPRAAGWERKVVGLFPTAGRAPGRRRRPSCASATASSSTCGCRRSPA